MIKGFWKLQPSWYIKGIYIIYNDNDAIRWVIEIWLDINTNKYHVCEHSPNTLFNHGDEGLCEPAKSFMGAIDNFMLIESELLKSL